MAASFVMDGPASAVRGAQRLLEQQEEAADAPRGPERGGAIQHFVVDVLRRDRTRRRMRRRASGFLHRLVLLLQVLLTRLELTHGKAPSHEGASCTDTRKLTEKVSDEERRDSEGRTAGLEWRTGQAACTAAAAQKSLR